MEGYKPYKKDSDYSYSLGAFPTFEAIKKRPDCVREVFCDESFTEKEKLFDECKKRNIPCRVNGKQVKRLSDKENVFVTAIIDKAAYEKKLDETCGLMADKSHLVLVNPSNMGNMGTILRSCLAFGIHDVAIISPAPDIMNPKVIRSSMGAIFSLRIKYYDSFDEYRELYQKHEVFAFMLDGKKPLSAADAPKPELYSLVFGNEATGLPEEFLHKGTSVIIPESPEVDSLNITIAVGIGLFLFTQGKF